MTEIQRQILSLLLDKYERSRAYTGENRGPYRGCVKPREVFPEYDSDYADMDRIRDFEGQLGELERAGLVAVKRQNQEISKIVPVLARLEEYYGILGRMPKKMIQSRLLETYQKMAETRLFGAFGREQCRRIQENRKPEYDQEKAEDLLAACRFLENNEDDVLERELSIAVFGDSKRWENHCRKAVCGVLQRYGDYDKILDGIEEERERDAALLEEFHVFPNPGYVYLKGDAILRWEDSQTLRLSAKRPMALSLEAFKGLEEIRIEGHTVMTVENLTSFHRIQRPGTFFVYLAGYHSRIKQKLLAAVARDNPGLEWLHFGDIDPDGFCIAEHLKRCTGIPFALYRMGIAELLTYRDYTKPLEENDRKKAKGLLEKGVCRETVEYMMEHDCKLEQEIVSWQEAGFAGQKVPRA